MNCIECFDVLKNADRYKCDENLCRSKVAVIVDCRVSKLNITYCRSYAVYTHTAW